MSGSKEVEMGQFRGQTPLVSVLIPTYNSSRFITQTLDSISQQSGTSFEILVSDDASTDETVTLVQSHPDARIRLLRRRRRVGAVRNAQACLRLARGEYLACVGHDDVLIENSLRLRARFLEEHPTAAFVHSAALDIDERGEPFQGYWSGVADTHEEGLLRSPAAFLDLLTSENRICAPSVMIRTAALRRVGNLNPSLTLTADWDAWLRLSKVGDIGYLRRPLVAYRWHEDNLTHTLADAAEGLMQRWKVKHVNLKEWEGREAHQEITLDTVRFEYAREALYRAYERGLAGKFSATTTYCSVATRIHRNGRILTDADRRLVEAAVFYATEQVPPSPPPARHLLLTWAAKEDPVLMRLKYPDLYEEAWEAASLRWRFSITAARARHRVLAH